MAQKVVLLQLILYGEHSVKESRGQPKNGALK